MTNGGYRRGPPDVMSRFHSGNDVDFIEHYFGTTPRFRTGSAEYAWLDGIISIEVGKRRTDELIIRVYKSVQFT